MTITSPKLPDITSKADLAVFGLGYAAGFALYVVAFRLSTPPPTTVALVAAIAALAIKSGVQAWQEREPPPISEQERQENLRHRLITFAELFSEGTRLYEADRGTQFILGNVVHLNMRWEPNPNYDPNATQEEGEFLFTQLPYVERGDEVDLLERVLALHVLWKAGIVTDAYADARLDELSDLCSREASIEEGGSGAVQEAGDSHFGAKLVKLMADKGLNRAELARRTGISMTRLAALESSTMDP